MGSHQTSARDFNDMIRALEEQGWTVKPTSRNHYQATPPGDGKIVHFSPSTGDWRAFNNTVSDLRRQGFKWPWPEVKKRSVRDEVPPTSSVTEPDCVTDDAVVQSVTHQSADDCYRALRDARELLHIADVDLRDAEASLKEAQERHAQRVRSRAEAAQHMVDCKKAFDEAFDAEKVA